MSQTQPPQFAQSSQATTALVLGILSLICMPLFGPFAWYMANQEIRGIDQGLRDPTNRGMAVAGKVLGIIGTVFIALAIIIFFLVFWLAEVEVS
jgi:uncharacterized membrane-anchored protein